MGEIHVQVQMLQFAFLKKLFTGHIQIQRTIFQNLHPIFSFLVRPWSQHSHHQQAFVVATSHGLYPPQNQQVQSEQWSLIAEQSRRKERSRAERRKEQSRKRKGTAEYITICGLDLCFLFFLKGLHTVTSFRISLQGLTCPHDVITRHSGAAAAHPGEICVKPADKVCCPWSPS